MKALIWILSFFVITFLNLLLGYAAGFRMGSILLCVVWYLTARALCNKWDRYKISKNADKSGVTPFEFIKEYLPVDMLNHCETIRGKEDELKSYLKQCSKERKITRAYGDIICQEYMSAIKTESPIIVDEKTDSIQDDGSSACD